MAQQMTLTGKIDLAFQQVGQSVKDLICRKIGHQVKEEFRWEKVSTFAGTGNIRVHFKKCQRCGKEGVQ